MTTERERILELVASGKLSPGDADRLLKQAEEKPRPNLFAWLFDPIDRLGTHRALLVGLLAVLLASLFSRAGVRFDGALDSHVGTAPVPPAVAVADAVVAWPLTALVLWLVSLVAARQGRFVDHFAAVGLSRVPALAIGAILAFSTLWPTPELVPGQIPDVNPVWLAVILSTVPFAVWQVVLLYRGFRTASGLRGLRCAVAGVVGIIVAEVLSKLGLYLFSRVS